MIIWKFLKNQRFSTIFIFAGEINEDDVIYVIERGESQHSEGKTSLDIINTLRLRKFYKINQRDEYLQYLQYLHFLIKV